LIRAGPNIQNRLGKVVGVKRFLKAGFLKADVWGEKNFGPSLNPFSQLGGLAFFFYWIVAVSGIYLYIVFDTSITGVYESIEYLTHDQWYLGGIMRSFHRYASDAMVLFMSLHILHEFSFDRYKGARAFSWFTGVPVLWLLYAAGISGYWLVWDELAQYIAIGTAEWLDWLPIFGEPVARNFLTPDSIDDRFFSLLIFMHIFLPLFLLAILWLHIQRISKPKINPPKVLAFSLMGSMLLLSLVFPAVSHEAADLAKVPGDIKIDWFYLIIYPMLDHVPAGFMWALAIGGSIGLVGMAIDPRFKRPGTAVVHLESCNGCERCMDDCPYAAISMEPRTDGQPFAREPVVKESNCVGCGICVGACPTSMPFRTATALLPGIDLAGRELAGLRDEIDALAKEEMPKVIAFNCQFNKAFDKEVPGGVSVVTLPCIGMLPPPFVDYVLSRSKASGVFLAGCGTSDCENRLGTQWQDERIARKRDPYLRARVPQERLATLWSASTNKHSARSQLQDFVSKIEALPPLKDAKTALKEKLALEEVKEAGEVEDVT
jgi:ferredoxin/coenzyme F420-reducing hydrogenase delta subunit